MPDGGTAPVQRLYADASEVVREALRAFHGREDPAEEDSWELAELLLRAIQGAALYAHRFYGPAIRAFDLPRPFS